MNIVIWFLSAVYACLIIQGDHTLRIRRARARGEIDFGVGQPLRFVVLSLITSLLVLPVYFYVTYRRLWAIGLGLVATVATFFATILTIVVLSLLAAPLIRG
jgi:hypothetical protein